MYQEGSRRETINITQRKTPGSCFHYSRMWSSEHQTDEGRSRNRTSVGIGLACFVQHSSVFITHRMYKSICSMLLCSMAPPPLRRSGRATEAACCLGCWLGTGWSRRGRADLCCHTTHHQLWVRSWARQGTRHLLASLWANIISTLNISKCTAARNSFYGRNVAFFCSAFILSLRFYRDILVTKNHFPLIDFNFKCTPAPSLLHSLIIFFWNLTQTMRLISQILRSHGQIFAQAARVKNTVNKSSLMLPQVLSSQPFWKSDISFWIIHM